MPSNKREKNKNDFHYLLKEYRKNNADTLHAIKKRRMRWLLTENKFKEMYYNKNNKNKNKNKKSK